MCKLIILSHVVLNPLTFAHLLNGGIHFFRLFCHRAKVIICFKKKE